MEGDSPSWSAAFRHLAKERFKNVVVVQALAAGELLWQITFKKQVALKKAAAEELKRLGEVLTRNQDRFLKQVSLVHKREVILYQATKAEVKDEVP